MRLTIRVTHEDEQNLEKIAELRHMTISDLIRDMIRNGFERQSASTALEEIKASINSMSARKGGNGNSEDIVEIRRIVTLIARAMPAVAREV